jgi:leucyl-tRNA synthetase
MILFGTSCSAKKAWKYKEENHSAQNAGKYKIDLAVKNNDVINNLGEIKNVEKLGWQMESHFYASHKDINRCAYAQFFKVELLNLDKDELSSEESEKHEVVWVPISDMEKNYWPVTEKEEIYSHFINGPHAFTGNGKIINSGKFDGLGSEAAKKEITEFAGGKMTVTYKLKDWVFSRQRYWGEPIPVIHCEKCGVVPVSEKDLPVKLPDVKNYEPSGTGESPLANISKWVNVKCPKCKGKAKRETNTMPQWAGSSWYYLRYEDPKNNKCLVDKKKEKYWSPVDMYVGGAEHATRHLIYARFWHKFLYDIGVVNYEEPFSQLKNQGLIMGEDGRKMSKRFGNVVNPDDVVASVGADTLRVFEMFMGPFEQSSSWSTNSIMGSRRFLDRVWRLKDKVSKEGDEKLTSLLHKTIKKVTEDIEKFGFNTAISSMMILSNEIEKAEKISKQDFEDFIKILAPFAPHITDELWSELGHKKSIHLESWPFFDASKIKEESVNIVVQINGKVRANFEAPVDISEKEVVEKALSLELVKKWTEGKEIRKTIFVKGKLLNIVV